MAKGGKVLFEFDVETAKAVSGVLKLVDSQKRAERQFGQTSKALGRQDKKFAKLSQNIRVFGGSLISLGAITAAGTSIITNVQKGIVQNRLFEDQLTSLLSLGENINNIGGVKSNVLNLAEGFGLGNNDIINSIFNLQSGASDLSKTIRDDLLKQSIELVKVTGTDLPTSLRAVLKTFLIYEDELGNANRAQNILFKTAELGFLNFTDLALQFPDVASAAKAMGIDIETLSASLIVATQKGGKTEKTFTGLRNVFLRMDKAIEAGLIPNTGTFVDKLQALSKVDSNLVAKIFGAETVSVISNLVEGADQVLEKIKIMKDLSGDITKARLLTRFQDTGFRNAELDKLNKSIIKNIPLRRNFAEGTAGDFDTRFGRRKVGIAKSLPVAFQGFVPLIAGIRETASRIPGLRDFFNEDLEAGGLAQIKALRRSGQPTRASALSIRLGIGSLSQGQEEELRASRPEGAGAPTNDDRADFFLKLSVMVEKMGHAAAAQERSADAQERTAVRLENAIERNPNINTE